MRVLISLLLLGIVPVSSTSAQTPAPLPFSGTGHVTGGDWFAAGVVSHAEWKPGTTLRVDLSVTFPEAQIGTLAAAGIKPDKVCILMTAERTFDADGWMRLPSDERMSTLLTPTGLAIEGGVQGAVTNRYGYPYRSPIDQFASLALSQVTGDGGTRSAVFTMMATAPADLPPGLYRLRFDIGAMAGSRLYNLNGSPFAQRPSAQDAGTSTYFYSPVIPASGTHVSGRAIDATHIQARIPWLLLAAYNSNGYRGVVAEEDRSRFAISDRSLIPDDVILPMYDENGKTLSYSLEPQFPADSIDSLQNVPWKWDSGELTVQVQTPNGTVTNVGTARFVAKSGYGPTTRTAAFTAWRPTGYGRYTVRASGWISDQAGRRYEGGGTYSFWIARRMTLATATFQGMPYPVGSNYGRDIQFNPPLPADVQVTATLYPNSNAADARVLSYGGKATPAGLFGAAQGMKSLALSAPGEYHARVLATYTDGDGHLWVCTMRHAGVVYSEDSGVTARGKKLSIGGSYVDRGETHFEGYVDADGEQHLAHVTFPYQAGDVLLIGSEGQGANKIEPVLTFQMNGDTSPWDSKLNGVGTTNLRIKTSNGYSPHLFPEYITDIEYYYAAAPRPGFMGRFLVGESIVRAPYWPVSPNSFGGQIGASVNGDTPGDIYRLIGGVVLRRGAHNPMYAGYLASAFLLPKGTNNNRVVAAGSEDLQGSTGEKARFFLVGLRPGTAFEVGSSLRAAVQVDPIVPARVRFILTWPDGREQTAEGTADRAGSWAGSTAWTLDVPGAYRYRLSATWNGFEGRMPGLPGSGGEFYVYSKSRPASGGLRIDGAAQRTFAADAGTTITGASTASSVRYALVTPGAVIGQGEVPVRGGKFEFRFEPAAVHSHVPIYDIVNASTGRPQIGRVVHLTFFSQERAADGTSFFDFARVILRGTTLIAAKASTPSSSLVSLAAVPVSRPMAATTRATASSPTATVMNGRSVREWDAGIDRLARRQELRLVAAQRDPRLAGTVHERWARFYRGVPVFGAELTRQVRDGVTRSVFGSMHEGLAIDTTPAIDAPTAERALADRGDADVSSELVILTTDDAYSLAWHVLATSPDSVTHVFVDARDGRRLLEYQDLYLSVGRRADDPTASAVRQHLLDRVGTAPGPAAGSAREYAGAIVRRAVRPVYAGETRGLVDAFVEMVCAAASGTPLTADHARPVLEAASSALSGAASVAEREDIERAFYRAFLYLLPADGTALSLRAATIQSARDLYGSSSTVERVLVAAWDAAGVTIDPQH